MSKIPKGTTHVWTPGFVRPKVGGIIYRRHFYKRNKGKWYSYSIDNQWVESKNTVEWYITEKKEGYLVTITRFNNPTFSIKEETV